MNKTINSFHICILKKVKTNNLQLHIESDNGFDKTLEFSRAKLQFIL